MTITGPNLAREIAGLSGFITSGSRGRMRFRSVRAIALVIVPRRTSRPQLESLIAGRPWTSPRSFAFLAGRAKRSSSAAT